MLDIFLAYESVGLLLIILLALLQVGLGSMPWDSWASASPHAIEYYFRRHQDVAVKSPVVQCQCPPYKECTIEYKINEDMLEFQNIQALLKDDELNELKKYIQSQKSETESPKKENIRSKRQTGEEPECCCPPRSVMMPTFITEKKFDEVVERLREKVLSE